MTLKASNGIDLQSQKITSVADPTNPQDAATKNYVDAAIQGLEWKNPVRAASTANLTLSGTQTVDGVALVANDRVLVKNQTTASANGLYVVAAGSWTRAVDMDATGEFNGAAVFVSEGTSLGNTQWVMTTDNPVTIGTTSIVWAQMGGGSSYTAGNGVTIISGVIAVDTTVVARKASATIGDGTTTTYTVNHNLATTDVEVNVKLLSSGASLLADWAVVDANNITVTFATAPATGTYRVTVLG